MMRTTNKFSIKALIYFLIFLIFSANCFADESRWVIAAEKFSYSKGQEINAVTDAVSESIPSDILEKINKTLVRNVYPDEKLERTRYTLRTERQSLYLQLTSEYKKKNSLVLNDYSDVKLKKTIRDEDKKIEEIRKKINENLKKLHEEEAALEKRMELAASGDTDSIEENQLKSFSRLFKRIFTKDSVLVAQENIAFYNDDVKYLYTPSEAALKDGYTGYIFEKNINSANINTLLTGTISAFGEYISVQVDMYVYPGAKKVASVMEIGAMEDLDLITSSLANQLVPYLTNSMPVELEFAINPSEAKSCDIFIDDVLQKTDGKKIAMQSGVHSIQFACEGFKTAETNYYFDGNKKYKIDVNMVELKQGTLTFELKKPLEGDILVNGVFAEKLDEMHTQIKINGNQILGEFISEDNKTAYFYVPEKYYTDDALVRINPKPFDRDKYIDTRRKWMYGTYSAFMVSLIPFFYTYGNLINQAELYKNRQVKYQEAMKWQNAYNVCSVITIVCGVAWGAELVHYLIAANSVLPAKAKPPKKSKINPEEIVQSDTEDDIIIEPDDIDLKEEEL